VNILYKKAFEFFTPVRLFSFVIIWVTLVDGFNFQFTNTNIIDFIINLLVRILIFFGGFFGIFGNGRTKKLRSFVISFPYLYLGTYNLFMFINTYLYLHLTTVIITYFIGMWLLLFGDKYE